jgi:hypothetical protein
MQTIPLKAAPNQTLSVLLTGQLVTLDVYQLEDGNLYMDVLLNSAPIVMGVICRNNTKIIRNLYFGFLGDFLFTDTQGSSNPTYDGLSGRYSLIYLSASEANDT